MAAADLVSDFHRVLGLQVPLLQALTKQERMVLADALSPKKFAQGEAIIEEGDVRSQYHCGRFRSLSPTLDYQNIVDLTF